MNEETKVKCDGYYLLIDGDNSSVYNIYNELKEFESNLVISHADNMFKLTCVYNSPIELTAIDVVCLSSHMEVIFKRATLVPEYKNIKLISYIFSLPKDLNSSASIESYSKELNRYYTVPVK